MFNVGLLGPDIRLNDNSGDPYAADVIFYAPMTNAIATSPYNGQAIPSAGSLGDYGIYSLGTNYIPQDAGLLSATVSTTGGSLPAGTYYIRVFGVASDNTTRGSTIEQQFTVTGSTSSISLSWSNILGGAVSYRVYVGTTSGGPSWYFTTTSTSYVLTTYSTGGTAVTSGLYPSSTGYNETDLANVTSNSGTRTQLWGRFRGGTGNYNTSPRRSPAIIFNHPAFNEITNGTGDFTIEFNVAIVGDDQTGSLKVFPFTFVGASLNQVTATVTSTLNPDAGGAVGGNDPPTNSTQTTGNLVVVSGEQMEMGMTIGSHTSPGGFGFGVGPADGTNRGYAVACPSNDTSANSYVNRGFDVVPEGADDPATTWGPYYIAIVRKSGVVSIFLNGKKINSNAGADEGGDGTQDASSTWNWNTFKFDTTTSGTNAGGITTTGWSSGTSIRGNNQLQKGLFIGGSYTYSSYGYDDDIYLQHFRITRGVARYSNDYTPEPIYTVSP